MIYWVYMKGIGPFEDIFFFNNFYRMATLCFQWVDRLVIVSACLIMLISCLLTPRSLRIRYLLLMFLLSGVSAVYLYLYNWLPAVPIWMSRIARYVRFDSLPVDKPTAFNAIMPLLSCLMILAFCATSFFHLWHTSNQFFAKVQFRNKVNASETVSRTFCHYLKNEILSQQAELRLLQRQLSPDLQPSVERLITHNEEIYERLTSVYNNIRERKIASHPLDLSSLLDQAAHTFAEREHVEMSLHIPQQPILVQGNSYQLQEVIQCILRNSLEAEHSPNVPFRLRITLTSSRRYAQIVLSNNSVRIPWNLRNQIFDPFFTTKNTQQNWGLGLSLCRNIITLHHGQIWVDEHTESGITWTDFYILCAPSTHDCRISPSVLKQSLQKVVIRQRWTAARLLVKRQAESTPQLLPPSRAIIRISARTAAFSSGTVDCTSKLTTLQAALHEKRQRGCDLSGYQRSYIAAIWFSSQIEPMLCNAKHGLNVWKQYQKALFLKKAHSAKQGAFK